MYMECNGNGSDTVYKIVKSNFTKMLHSNDVNNVAQMVYVLNVGIFFNICTPYLIASRKWKHCYHKLLVPEEMRYKARNYSILK